MYTAVTLGFLVNFGIFSFLFGGISTALLILFLVKRAKKNDSERTN